MTQAETYDTVARDQVLVEGYKHTLVDEYSVAILAALLTSFRDRVNGANVSSLAELTRSQRSRLIALIESDTFLIEKRNRKQLLKGLRGLALTQSDFAAQLTESKPVKPSRLIAAAEDNPMGSGDTFVAIVAAWAVAHNKRASNLIRRATMEGIAPADAIRAVRGTRNRNFRDGELAVTGKNIATSVNTAAQHVSVTALAETMSQNFKYYRWVSVLDGRTSFVCRSLAGKVFQFGEGPLPPQHPNCRSSIMPMDSKDVRPVSRPTYFDWLKDQPAGFQDGVIGKTRGKLLRNGGISVTDFARLQLDKNFNPSTLEQLRDRIPSAFRRAGIDL